MPRKAGYRAGGGFSISRGQSEEGAFTTEDMELTPLVEEGIKWCFSEGER